MADWYTSRFVKVHQGTSCEFTYIYIYIIYIHIQIFDIHINFFSSISHLVHRKKTKPPGLELRDFDDGTGRQRWRITGSQDAVKGWRIGSAAGDPGVGMAKQVEVPLGEGIQGDGMKQQKFGKNNVRLVGGRVRWVRMCGFQKKQKWMGK